MAVFQLGPVIRSRREELGLSQEDLADGICSVPTLSRIENGERMPTKNHFEMLMQRLGYSTTALDWYTEKRDFQIHELKFQIRQAYVARNLSLAGALLEQMEALLAAPTNTDQQFVRLYQILLGKEELPNDQRLQRLEDALLLTCPKYKTSHIPKVLTYEEIILLNNIAICYSKAGRSEQAISILRSAKDYYDRHVVISEEALRTQSMILYNLSKLLGTTGQYNECIAVCDLGISLAKTHGRCQHLGLTLFNRGWALLQRDQEADRENARHSLEQAYAFCSVMGQEASARQIAAFYRSTYGESL